MTEIIIPDNWLARSLKAAAEEYELYLTPPPKPVPASNLNLKVSYDCHFYNDECDWNYIKEKKIK